MPSEKKIMSVLGPTAVLSGIVYNQNLSFKQREREQKEGEGERGEGERGSSVSRFIVCGHNSINLNHRNAFLIQ